MRFLPSRSTTIVITAFAAIVLSLLWAIKMIDEDEQREAQAPKMLEPTDSPWTVPGFKSSVPMRIWRDPDTGCQFLIMPDGDPLGLRPAVPCPDPEWVNQQKAKPPQETAK